MMNEGKEKALSLKVLADRIKATKGLIQPFLCPKYSRLRRKLPMSEVNKETLVIQSTNISSALSGLETLLYQLPPANEVKVSDLNQIIGTVAAITALVEKNVGDVSHYFEY